MSEDSCPSCSIPLSEASFGVGICPCCGHGLNHAVLLDDEKPVAPVQQPVAAVVPLVQTVPVVRKEKQYPRNWALVGFIALVAIVIASLSDHWLPANSVTSTSTSAPLIQVPARPVDRPLYSVRMIEILPMPAIATEMDLVVKEPLSKVQILDPVVTREIILDNLDGTTEIVAMGKQDRLSLKGRVKTLIINGVTGSAFLDASRLVAREIIVKGEIHGNPNIYLSAPGGEIQFLKTITGNAVITIQASYGHVVFRGDDVGLTGGVVMTVHTQRIEVLNLMNGGAKMTARLSDGGTIRAVEMDGGATIRYKSFDGTTSKIKVDRGDIRGGAQIIMEK